MTWKIPTVPTKSRRIKILRIETDTFLEMLRGMDGIKRIRCDGIPEDARVVGSVHTTVLNCVELAIESDEFDAVPEGQVPPELVPTFKVFTGAQPTFGSYGSTAGIVEWTTA